MPVNRSNKKSSQFIIWEMLQWEPNDSQLAQFIELQKLIREWNKIINLTRLIDGDDYWIAQICDSLLPLYKELEDPKLSHKFIDVGSGCGFPGIAIAIALPNSKITLLDSSNKKTTFLKKVSNEIGLGSRITVVTNRAESAGKDPVFRGDFDYAVARAVAPATVVAEYLIPFLNSTGKAFIYKGSWTYTDQKCLNIALTELNAQVEQIHKFKLPNNRGLRNIISISSIKECPDQYPRSIGKPKKNPLGS